MFLQIDPGCGENRRAFAARAQRERILRVALGLGVPFCDVTRRSLVAVTIERGAIERGGIRVIVRIVRVNMPREEIERHVVLLHIVEEILRIFIPCRRERARRRQSRSPNLQIRKRLLERARRLGEKLKELGGRVRLLPELLIVRLVPDFDVAEFGLEAIPLALAIMADHLDGRLDPVRAL